MTEEEARSLGCVTFSGEDVVTSMAESIFAAHKMVAGMSRCFDPLSTAPQKTVDAVIGKIASVVNACFGIFFGADPSDRYAGDLFLQVTAFCEMLAQDHIFPDGNKRTALVVSLAIMSMKGVIVELPDPKDPSRNEVYRWIQNVVSGDASTSEMADALRTMASFGSYGYTVEVRGKEVDGEALKTD